jgi:hypothetical protein
VIERELDFSPRGTGEGNGGIPEDAMVADQIIRAGIDCRLKRGGATVDARSDFPDGAIIFDLETVVGTIEIADFRAPGTGVAEGNQFLKGGHAGRLGMAGQVVKCFLASKFRR